LAQCSWKEYTSDDGKTYYHNVTTKESKWTLPPELEELKKKIAAEEQARIHGVSVIPGSVTASQPGVPAVPQIGIPAMLPGIIPQAIAPVAINIPP